MDDVEWVERQRRFQAQVLDDPDPTLDHLWFRTTVGSATPSPPPRLGRVGRAALLVVAGAAVVGLLLLFGLPRVLTASVAALWGGATVLLVLSGPSPRAAVEPAVPLLALWSQAARPGDPPRCVAPILAGDRRRLGVDGEVTVVGTARPGGTFGAFADTHLVWPQAPPRPPRPDDPAFGE